MEILTNAREKTKKAQETSQHESENYIAAEDIFKTFQSG